MHNPLALRPIAYTNGVTVWPPFRPVPVRRRRRRTKFITLSAAGTHFTVQRQPEVAA